MGKKGFFAIAVILLIVLWLYPIFHGWSQSKPVLTIHSESAVLMDGKTGQVLFIKDPEKQISPASLVKVMTLYLAFDGVKRGNVKLDQEEVVSKRAWKMGGSQMFLKVGDKVKFIELIKGVAAISANDAALAIAEFLAGSEEVFVHKMNEKAKALGLTQTHFVNCHGLHAEGQQTSAMDMAHLGFHYIHEHPDALKFHALPEYAYRDIKQKNWNPLLNLGKGVDGIKTGYLTKSGYHILFSAKRDSQRLIGVVMGAETPESRESDALKLIGYGFKNFSTRTLVKEGEVVGTVKVPRGNPPEVGLSATKALLVTLPKDREQPIPLRKEIPSSVNPPVNQGAVLGRLVLDGEGFPRKEIDLVAAQDVRYKSHAVYYIIGIAAVGCFLVFVFLRRRNPRKKRKRKK
jgi:D-alanyl-D-alanine carboxypeptidase (penicillin-binding protein 5/6)